MFDLAPHAGLVGVEPAMDQVPQLPVQGEQQRGGSGLPGLAEGADATLQTVGQLLAGGKTEGSNWWWPQGEAVGNSRPVGGQWFPSIDKEASGADSGLGVRGYGRPPTSPVARGARSRAGSSSLCNPPWPGGGSGQEETSGGYPYMVHVLHDLYCHGRD